MTSPAVKIAPSLLSADFSALGLAAQQVASNGADWIHLDVMDGRFVPNLTIGPPVIAALRRHTQLPFDVHLMMIEPEKFLKEFVNAGAQIVTVHQEACLHLHRTLMQIHELGARAGVAINPATPVETLEHILPLCDLALVMTVNPGFAGQKFISECIEKIRRLRVLANRLKPDLEIEVDGGIDAANAHLTAQAGANVFVAGASVFGATDQKQAISMLRAEAQAGRKTNR